MNYFWKNRLFKTILIYFCFFIIGLGVLLRGTEVLSHNFVFGFDQGRDYMAVRSIVVDKKITLIGSEIGAGAAGFQGIFHGPFYFYSLTIPFILFGGDPYGGVALMFVFGILTLILSYHFGNKLFGKPFGIVLATLVGISAPVIAQSRMFWNTNPSSLFILLSLYFTYLSLKNDNGLLSSKTHKNYSATSTHFIQRMDYRNLFLAAFFAAFTYNFQLAIAIQMCLTLFIFLFIFKEFRKITKVGMVILGFVVGFFPMILFEVRHNFMAIRGLLNYLFKPKDTAITSKFLELHGKDNLGTFIFSFLDSFPRSSWLPPVIAFLILFILFWYFFLKEKDIHLKKFLLFLFASSFVSFFVFMLMRNSLYAYYITNLILVYLILISYVIAKAVIYHKTIPLLFVSVIAISAVFEFIPSTIRTFQYDVRDYGGIAKFSGKKDAIDYIYRDAGNKKFGLLIFSPPIYTYPYDYILSWYGKKQYNFIPKPEKKVDFYLLIEPDSKKPWTYKGWLQTVIKNGRIIKTVKLPSGFIVQKREEIK